MSKEIDAFKEIWYGNKTEENFFIVMKALEALDVVRGMNIIHPIKCEAIVIPPNEPGSVYQITVPTSVLYLSKERSNLLEEVFIKWR